MDRLRTACALILFAVVAAAAMGEASAEICNRVVAIVNDDVVTLYELNAKMKEVTGLEPAELRKQDESKYLDARRKVLDLIIDEKITSEKIKELSIQVNESEIDAAIEKIKRDNRLTQEDLLEGLKKRGIDYETYREVVKKDLERMRLINYEVRSKIIIRDEKIKEYYEQHKEEFRTEERVHLAAIFLKRENPEDPGESRSLLAKAQGIVVRLNAGESFERLAKALSQGPGAEEGGDLGFFKTSQLDPELKAAIASLGEGDVSEPVVRPAGVQIIKVLEVRKGSEKPLEEARDAIYAALYKEEVNKRYTSWIKELREKAYTKIIF